MSSLADAITASMISSFNPETLMTRRVLQQYADQGEVSLIQSLATTGKALNKLHSEAVEEDSDAAKNFYQGLFDRLGKIGGTTGF